MVVEGFLSLLLCKMGQCHCCQNPYRQCSIIAWHLVGTEPLLSWGLFVSGPPKTAERLAWGPEKYEAAHSMEEGSVAQLAP